jgi:hypothetical protein
MIVAFPGNEFNGEITRRWADEIISEAEFQAKKKQILGI